MKTKHLFYSLALASAFAACTQEELVEAPVVKDNVADRPMAGVVEFSTEGVESRFNYEKSVGWEKGDVLGMYLMDNFVDGSDPSNWENWHVAEHYNANGTYWKYQNHWFAMYQLTNSIQSNYPYTYNEKGKWTNPAKLVEGNYFSMFPRNEKATNRRELWHAIDPTVELKEVSSSTSTLKKYQNVENQLWLGYNQVYRDETPTMEGVLEVDIDMKSVLVPLRFKINNNSNNTVILDKISFKNASGNELPTLAYVRPATSMDLAKKDFGWVKPSDAKEEWANCGSEYKAYGLYDEAAEARTWTRKTIQDIVEWTYPGEETIPYGLEGEAAQKAYEYSFSYPKNVSLAPGVDGGSLLYTYIVVPAMENDNQWEDLQVCIYGWQKDNGVESGWSYGMLTPKELPGSTDNYSYSFNLNDLVKVWSDSEQADETKYYRDVNVKFSEFSWKTVDQSVVASTLDMEKMVESYLAQNDGNVELTVVPDKAGIEITADFLAMLKKDSKDNGRAIDLTFDGTRGGKITFNDNNTMAISATTTETGDKVTFNYTNGIKLVNNASQTVAGGYRIQNASVINNGTLAVEGYVAYVENSGIMTVSSNDNPHNNDEVGILNNSGSVTLFCHATIGTLRNYSGAEVVVEAFVSNSHGYNYATVDKFYNYYDHTCSECIAAELTVKSGTMNVTELYNEAKLTNDAIINVSRTLTNKCHGENQWIDGYQHVYVMQNNGSIVGQGLVLNEGDINNAGKISARVENKHKIVNNTTSVDGGLLGVTKNNEGEIYAYNGKILELTNTNNAVLYIMSITNEVTTTSESIGTIVFNGVAAEHIGTTGRDIRAFRTVKDMTTAELFPMMTLTNTDQLWTAYNLVLGNATTDADKYEAIERIVIECTDSPACSAHKVNFRGTEGKTYSFENADLVIKDNCQLHIEGAINVVVEKRVQLQGYNGQLHIGSNSTLENAFGQTIHGDSENSIAKYGYELNSNVATVYTAEGLFNVAKNINSKVWGNDVDIILAGNIDLEGKAWTPIGNDEVNYRGTFDGKGFTISNLSVTGIDYVGLIGSGDQQSSAATVIKNLYIKGATLSANHYVGAVAGHILGKVENCHVSGVTVNCTAANGEDGDKAGAIVGLLGDDSEIASCSATDCKINAGRDAGQIVGSAAISYGAKVDAVAYNVKVKDNGTYKGDKDKNIKNEIIGRKN